MSCSAGCMDMSIPWESHTEGSLVRKRNSTDPGFGISYKCPGGRDHFWKASQGELRQLHQRSKGQAGGIPSSACRRNPHTQEGQRDYRGKQGLLAREEMGRAQALVCTLAYTEQTPPHRRPYVTLCPGPLQSPVLLHNSLFLMAGDQSPPSNSLAS